MVNLYNYGGALMKKSFLFIMLSALIFLCVACANTSADGDGSPTTEKPVIYLYPEEKTDVSVKLDYSGEFLFTYPAYNDGWEVTAYPDGTIVSDGNEYSYLFWDGYCDVEYDLSEGFVVKGEDTEQFLVETLQYLGLTPKEYNEFIVYWLPKMINNNYNLITFQGAEYTDNAVLTILPEPDNIGRVFMVFKALDSKIEIKEPILTPFERAGFTVIEWGGTQLFD